MNPEGHNGLSGGIVEGIVSCSGVASVPAGCTVGDIGPIELLVDARYMLEEVGVSPRRKAPRISGAKSETRP